MISSYPIEAFPIEFSDGTRRIVTHTAKGGNSWTIDEAVLLWASLSAAIERANDPTPLPEAAPNLPIIPPPVRAGRKPVITHNLDDLA